MATRTGPLGQLLIGFILLLAVVAGVGVGIALFTSETKMRGQLADAGLGKTQVDQVIGAQRMIKDKLSFVGEDAVYSARSLFWDLTAKFDLDLTPVVSIDLPPIRHVTQDTGGEAAMEAPAENGAATMEPPAEEAMGGQPAAETAPGETTPGEGTPAETMPAAAEPPLSTTAGEEMEKPGKPDMSNPGEPDKAMEAATAPPEPPAAMPSPEPAPAAPEETAATPPASDKPMDLRPPEETKAAADDQMASLPPEATAEPPAEAAPPAEAVPPAETPAEAAAASPEERLAQADLDYKRALALYTGANGPKQPEEAAKLFAKAAIGGHPGAQYSIGLMHYLGQGVEKNYKKAAEWFGRAAEQDNAAAQYNLGIMYYQGLGVPKDDRKAFRWISAAAKNGDKKAIVARDALMKALPKDVTEPKTGVSIN